ncbi:hypothetical protein BH09ACT3_BH09ACT3_05730 [soil metagenome]
MSETARPVVDRPPRPRADLRRLDRRVAAVLMPIGPAAVAVLRFVLPGEPVGESIIANPDAQRLVVGLGMIALFTLLPGAYAALQLLGRRSPRLTAWAAALLIPGYLGMTGLFASDAVAMASFDLGMDAAGIDRIVAAMAELPTMTILVLVFVVGHIAGTVLLGAAALDARAVPVAVGILLIVSQPLHLLAVITSLRWLDLIAWGLTTVGMAFLAWRVLRTPDPEWDLPPVPGR